MEKRKRRRSDRAGRPAMSSPGRPRVAGRAEQQRFWKASARGLSSEGAAVSCGVSSAVGVVGSVRTCCDDRLNPASISRFGTRSGLPKPGSSRRSGVWAIQCPRRIGDRALQDRGHPANDVDTEAFAFTTRPRTHFKRAAGRKGIPKVPRFAGPSHWPAGYSRWHSVRENTNRLHVVPRHTTLKLCCTNSCSLNARPRHHRCRLIWTRPNAKDTEARILVTTGPRIHPKFAAVRKGISKCTPFPALSHWLASHARDHSFS